MHFSSDVMHLNLPIIYPQNIYLYVYENNLKEVFSNVYISLQLYLTLSILNCEAEKKNSKLELILKTPEESPFTKKI